MEHVHFEAGQLLHNNPIGYECPDYVDALLASIRLEIGRVYWNVNQKKWGEGGFLDVSWAEWDEQGLSYDPGIPGIEWRPYYNWGGAPEDPDWDQAQANAPNFCFEDVQIRWYKRFGRSMNTNKEWTPDQWVAWFDRCLAVIRTYGKENDYREKLLQQERRQRNRK